MGVRLGICNTSSGLAELETALAAEGVETYRMTYDEYRDARDGTPRIYRGPPRITYMRERTGNMAGTVLATLPQTDAPALAREIVQRFADAGFDLRSAPAPTDAPAPTAPTAPTLPRFAAPDEPVPPGMMSILLYEPDSNKRDALRALGEALQNLGFWVAWTQNCEQYLRTERLRASIISSGELFVRLGPQDRPPRVRAHCHASLSVMVDAILEVATACPASGAPSEKETTPEDGWTF